MPVAAIVAFIQLAIKAAPTVKVIYDDGKALAQSLFGAGLITKKQQDDLMFWADAHQAAVLDGKTPPEFVVE